MSDGYFLSITFLWSNARLSVKSLHLALKFSIFAVNKITNKNMKITIINSERNEKRYTRVELEEFVAQLRDGTYRQQYVRDFNKEVCFAAEWVKQNGGYWKTHPISDETKAKMKAAKQASGTDCVATFPDGHEETFPTMLDAANATGLNAGSVKYSIEHNNITKNGYKFRKL